MAPIRKSVEFMNTNYIHLSARTLKTLRYIGIGMLLVGFVYSLSLTMAKNVRFNASEQKHNYMRAMDLSPNLAMVWWNSEGTIIRWTHGMTLLTGRTSKEMIGKNLSLIDPDYANPESVLKRVTSSPISDWLAEKYVDIVAKDGTIHKLRMNILDISVPDQAEPFRSVLFDRLGVSKQLMLDTSATELGKEYLKGDNQGEEIHLGNGTSD